MAQPDFTPYERYLINMYKAGVGSLWLTFLLMGGSVLLFLYGLRQDDDAMLFTGFGLLLLWEIYSTSQQPRAMKAIHSVFDKYEARIEELEGASGTNGSG